MKVQQPAGKKLFAEEQLLRKTWVWWLAVISALIPMILMVVVLLADQNIKPGEMVIAVTVVTGVNVLHLWLLYMVRLDTVITDEGVYYRWWPFKRKYHVVARTALGNVYARKYPYLNSGYHRRKGFGKVNVVSGNKGLQMELTNGQMIYLGTQRLPIMEQALLVIANKSTRSEQ